MRNSKLMGLGFDMRKLLKPIPEPEKRNISIDELRKTEWSHDFEDLQRHRLIMGALRYGRLNAPNKPDWDRPPDIIRRIQAYQKTGNLEFLVDAANLCMLEFEEGKHPDRHFISHDDSQHTEIKK